MMSYGPWVKNNRDALSMNPPRTEGERILDAIAQLQTDINELKAQTAKPADVPTTVATNIPDLTLF
jgi:hypothetical protein